LVQPGELPGGVEVPDLCHHRSPPPARRVGFRQCQSPSHEEHLAWGPEWVTDRQEQGEAWRDKDSDSPYGGGGGAGAGPRLDRRNGRAWAMIWAQVHLRGGLVFGWTG
jgi:hypothetical protein